MKTPSSVVLVCCLVTASGIAQTPSQPNLVLTIFGGVVSGNSLWSVARFSICVRNTTDNNCSSAVDTLRLTRDASSSLIAGAMGTYFTGPNVGITAEVFYLGLPLDDGCSGVFYNPDPGADPFYGPRNEQTCSNVTAASPSTSAIAFFGGLVLRAASSRGISPYVRGSLGIVSYPSGTVEMSGSFIQGGNVRSRAIIIDENPKRIGFSGQLAAGITARLGPGYQFRFELRDVLVPLKRVTGPAVLANGLQAPTVNKLFHQPGLIMGLDVVLEKKRGRRY